MGDPLLAFLSGKRTSKRHALALPVVVYGRSAQIEAVSVDISANGIQLGISIQEALPGVTGAIEIAAFTWLRNGFPDGIHIVFPSAHVVVHADPVRQTVDPDQPDQMLLGCRLRQDFTDDEISRLGLRPEACGPENEVTDAPPSAEDTERLDPNQSMPIRLHRSIDRGELLFEGEVVAVSDNSLTVLVRGAQPQDVLSQLDCLELYFEVVQGTRSVWSSRAVVNALPMVTADGIELGLWSDTGPRRPLALA